MAQPPRVDSDTDAAGAAEHPLAALDPRLSVLPFAPLGHFPTRIHRVDGALSSAVELWVKRDDESGVRYGGNKVRKLEFLIGEARARGAERLVTMGGFGSHHVLATAIYGQAAGMGVDAIVFPQPLTPHVLETVRAGAAAGCRYHPIGSYAGVVPAALRLRARRRSVWIAAGGSSVTGSLGYVAAAHELRAQIERGNCLAPDVIYVALGSCGTVAGLLVGLRLVGLTPRVVAVRVVPAVVCNRRLTLRLQHQVERRLAGLAVPVGGPESELQVDGRFYGGAYGRPTPEAERAVERAASSGILLETTYTGKTFAALVADAEAGLLDGKRVLFWNTFSSADLAPLLAAAPDPATLPRRLAELFSAENSS